MLVRMVSVWKVTDAEVGHGRAAHVSYGSVAVADGRLTSEVPLGTLDQGIQLDIGHFLMLVMVLMVMVQLMMIMTVTVTTTTTMMMLTMI